MEEEINNNHLTPEETPNEVSETIEQVTSETPDADTLPSTPDTDAYDDDTDIATAEEIEAYAREVAEKRARKSKGLPIDNDEREIPVEDEQITSNIDPYLEPDPTMPRVEYKESIFLSRGCNHCPESYVPIKEQELRSCCKVGASNWMKGIRKPCEQAFDVVEVRFKNNRKEFFRLPDGIDVNEGDVVAVEGVPGHDVGIVSLIGEACRIQMRRKKVDPASESIKKLFRRAKTLDIEKWVEALCEESTALLRTRRITEGQNLVMKVNDVEFQGDRSKAIFYYTADDRVDFRNLIKVLADEFKVRVEMKQIGVRQEAGKVGGIGTCGRELCCSTWLTNFKSVTTGVAKAQQILPNPQKLAGQCGKLKCCLNFEYEVYVDALKKFPPANTPIRFQKGLALYKKTDVFRGIMWYSYEGENELHAIPAESVKKIIDMNRDQQYPEKLEDFQVELMSTAALVQEATNAEVEMELRRLADAGDENKSAEDSRDNRSNRDNRRDNRYDHGDRNNRSDRRDSRFDRGDRSERPQRNDDNRSDRGDRPERSQYNNDNRSDRGDRSERPQRYNDNRSERGDRPERSQYNNDNRSDRGDRSNRPQRSNENRPERTDRPERSDRPQYNNDNRSNRGDRPDRPQRNNDNSSERNDRPDRNNGHTDREDRPERRDHGNDRRRR